MARLVAERSDLLAPLGECFREHGYEGASLTRISEATGLGKGSLYHFFPGGKAEMMEAVLEDVTWWFEAKVFAPLETMSAASGIRTMCDAVLAYFESGRRVCLVGVLALADTRDAFSAAIAGYFRRWMSALTKSFERAGSRRKLAVARAREVVYEIQGALVLSRALDDQGVFRSAVERIRASAT
jgi:AcrR family transcriptional regulator